MKSLLYFTLFLENEGYLLKIVFDYYLNYLRSRSQRFRKLSKSKVHYIKKKYWKTMKHSVSSLLDLTRLLEDKRRIFVSQYILFVELATFQNRKKIRKSDPKKKFQPCPQVLYKLEAFR